MNSMKNSVRLIGHLGGDPEVLVMENGRKLAKLNLATNDVYVNGQGEKVTNTQWHRVVAWGKTAEIAEQYLSKGQEIAIEGRLVSRSFTGKDGQQRYTTEVEAGELLMLGRKKDQAAI